MTEEWKADALKLVGEVIRRIHVAEVDESVTQVALVLEIGWQVQEIHGIDVLVEVFQEHILSILVWDVTQHDGVIGVLLGSGLRLNLLLHLLDLILDNLLDLHLFLNSLLDL